MKIPESLPFQRITLRSIGAEVLSQINLEKGLGYTIKMMLLAPGNAIQEYLFEDRRRMMRPLPLVLLLTALATFVSFQFLDLDKSFSAPITDSVQMSGLPPELIPLIELLRKLGKQYFNVILMSSIPAMALASYWMFRKARLYYAEHLVVNMYIYSIQTCFLLIFLPLIWVLPLMAFMILIITLLYFIYSFRHIFQISIKEAAWKAALFLVLSQVIQNVVVSFVAIIIWAFFL